MARETKTIEVSGLKLDIKHLPGSKARRLFHRLVRTSGTAIKDNIEEIVELATSGAEIGEGPAAVKMAGLFFDVVRAIPEDLEDALFEAFREHCSIYPDGLDVPIPLKQEIFDDKFGGDVLGQDAWLVHCMKHNFLGFLSSGGRQPS